jgi:hypothetical protein
MASTSKRLYTDNQKAFLEAFEEDPTDIRKAMNAAGYAVGVSKKEVTDSLHEEMVEIASKILAKNAGKAAMATVSVLENGNIAGASNVLKAAQMILDRAGVITKSDTLDLKIPSGGIVIMPAKEYRNAHTDTDTDDTSSD